MSTTPTADKTVFLSYRRALSVWEARAVMMDLRTHRYRVGWATQDIVRGWSNKVTPEIGSG